MTKRPFPWKCGVCRKRAANPAIREYRAELEHDGRAYEIHIPDLEVILCSECGSITLEDEANRRVTCELRRAAGLLRPEDIRGLRERLDLTLRARYAREVRRPG